MPLDPQAQALIDQVAAAGGKPAHQLPLEEVRRALETRTALTAGEPPPVAEVRQAEAPGPGGPVPLRLYVPGEAGAGPWPALVYFHGGGWVRGSLNTHDVVCRALANGAGCLVVSVDYRLAPEHRFPAAFDDALAATRWVAEQARQLGVDPEQIAVGGDSAGGNLAAAVALAARDQGGPRLAFQLLIYPVTDRDFETASYRANAEGYLLSRADMQWYWDQYVPSQAERDDPRAAPLRAAELAGLPPALVITAEYDPLRDEGRAYAERLRAAGVPTDHHDYPGMIHGFVSSAGVVEQGRRATAECAAALRAAFAAADRATGSGRTRAGAG